MPLRGMSGEYGVATRGGARYSSWCCWLLLLLLLLLAIGYQSSSVFGAHSVGSEVYNTELCAWACGLLAVRGCVVGVGFRQTTDVGASCLVL